MIWIPRTKLHWSELGSDVLQRPELLKVLHRAVTTKRLTLISAQAGAGKTTLVTLLAEDHPQLPVASITLDEADNNPATFLSLLVAAIGQTLPDFTVTHLPDGTTELAGPLSDSAAVYGLLNKLRDLGLVLISVRRFKEPEDDAPDPAR